MTAGASRELTAIHDPLVQHNSLDETRDVVGAQDQPVIEQTPLTP